jgi:periplasmic divalent cation tolerance protein
VTIVSVYAVFSDAEEAERIGRNVIEEKLAACINMLAPVRSIYRWQDTIESREEVAAVLKTTEANAEALIGRIAELHSYEVPCVATWPVELIWGPYADWVRDSVG